MKLSNLFMIALLAGTLGVLGCDSDPATGNGGTGGEGTAGSGGSGTAGTGGAPDPSEVCDTGLCVGDAGLRAQCEQEVQACIDNNPEINWDECILGVQAARCEDIGG